MNAVTHVILGDDDLDLLSAQLQSLEIAGFQPEGFFEPTRALAATTADFPDLTLSDVMMPGMDGFQFFDGVRAIDADLPVILPTGHGDVAMAGKAMPAGAGIS